MIPHVLLTLYYLYSVRETFSTVVVEAIGVDKRPTRRRKNEIVKRFPD